MVDYIRKNGYNYRQQNDTEGENSMRAMKKTLAVICLSLIMILGISMAIPVSTQTMTVEAANKIKLNKKKATIYEGKSVQLKIKGTKAKVKWTSNKTSVAKVNSKGKVTGKKAGKAVITAKVKNKKYKCTITVKKKKQTNNEEKITEEEVTAAVWLDFLTKRLRNPDSLVVSDIIVWNQDASPSLEIVYSAQNAYGGTNKKSMVGSLYGNDSNVNGITPYIILPNGKYSFPNRRNLKPNYDLTSKDKRLDINKIKHISVSYKYNFYIDSNNMLGWYEKNKLYNEILQ